MVGGRMVEHIDGWMDGWMDGWTDAVLTLGFFLDILHVRKVAKKILSFSKYSKTRTQYVYWVQVNK